MADNTDEVVRVRDFIAKSVSEYWTATGKAMLLSALGLKVRTTFPSAPSLMPDGLSAFLSSWPTVRIVGHPEIPEKVGAIPLDAKIPDDVTELFSERRSVLIGTSQPSFETVRRPRYVTEFWRAFYSPINGRRFIIPPTPENPNLRVVERADGEEEPRGYEVLASDLSLLPAQAPLFEKVQATSQKIRAWLARNGLAEQLFVSRVSETSQSAVALHTLDQRNLVALALARLDPSDQARIFVPLDIVAKMLAGIR